LDKFLPKIPNQGTEVLPAGAFTPLTSERKCFLEKVGGKAKK